MFIVYFLGWLLFNLTMIAAGILCGGYIYRRHRKNYERPMSNEDKWAETAEEAHFHEQEWAAILAERQAQDEAFRQSSEQEPTKWNPTPKKSAPPLDDDIIF